MAYKSILTYIDRHNSSKAQLSNAIRLAKHYDATLTTISYAPNYHNPDYDLYDGAGKLFADSLEQAQSVASLNADQARQDCSDAKVRSSVETFVSLKDEWGDEFGRHARYSDLVVLSPIDDESNKRTASNALEAALYIGDVPVMICPPEMKSIAPETILIGWNGSRETLRSVRSALPALRDATTVNISIVDQSTSEKASAEDLAQFLKKHGVDAFVSTLSSNLKTVDETLRARAAEIGAGLIVIGAYSHSWFREYFLGGVTQELISRPSVPVFLAH